MEGVLAGSLVLWILTALCVIPLTNISVNHCLQREGISLTSSNELPVNERHRYEILITKYYILWDILVLGIAGFIGGLLGFYFFGISLKLKGWPGMIAMVIASLLGLTVRNAA